MMYGLRENAKDSSKVTGRDQKGGRGMQEVAKEA
jgi:hypothetical protein